MNEDEIEREEGVNFPLSIVIHSQPSTSFFDERFEMSQICSNIRFCDRRRRKILQKYRSLLLLAAHTVNLK